MQARAACTHLPGVGVVPVVGQPPQQPRRLQAALRLLGDSWVGPAALASTLSTLAASWRFKGGHSLPDEPSWCHWLGSWIPAGTLLCSQTGSPGPVHLSPAQTMQRPRKGQAEPQGVGRGSGRGSGWAVGRGQHRRGGKGRGREGEREGTRQGGILISRRSAAGGGYQLGRAWPTLRVAAARGRRPAGRQAGRAAPLCGRRRRRRCCEAGREGGGLGRGQGGAGGEELGIFPRTACRTGSAVKCSYLSNSCPQSIAAEMAGSSRQQAHKCAN